MPRPANYGVLFTSVVTFCLVLVGWWIYFLVGESYDLDRATELIRQGETQAALRVMGADETGDFSGKARQFRHMFTYEGIALGGLILAGVFMLYRSILRENRLRREQEHFLTGATHHLKTPLATVRLGIESMLAGSMPEHKREKYLKAMLGEVDHLEKDLSNLLAAGGLQSWGKGLELLPGDLAADVRSAIDSMSDRFAAADVAFDADVTDGLVVARDRESMHMILHNLLDNAVKYAAESPAVSLTLQAAGDKAQLTIRDNGRGIPRDELPRIFERYFRGRTGDYKGGSGIGLYLVKEIVESHGGTVTARSDGPGHGTEFRVELPLAKEAA